MSQTRPRALALPALEDMEFRRAALLYGNRLLKLAPASVAEPASLPRSNGARLFIGNACEDRHHSWRGPLHFSALV